MKTFKWFFCFYTVGSELVETSRAEIRRTSAKLWTTFTASHLQISVANPLGYPAESTIAFEESPAKTQTAQRPIQMSKRLTR